MSPSRSPFKGPCICGGQKLALTHRYTEMPAGETGFPFSRDAPAYLRDLWRCDVCGHFMSVHAMGGGELYGGEYVDASYGGPEGFQKAFNKIVSLPSELSDNAGRVRRVRAYAERRLMPGLPSGHVPEILDVGSGLCVFLHAIWWSAGWTCTALDPDPRAVRHARETVGINAVQGDFRSVEDIGPFDIITFNRVLEHVPDPVAMLAQSVRFLRPGGFVHVELPDGEAAIGEGPGREEFFIEHFHVFSAASFTILADRAGMRIMTLERLRDPSGKYTLAGMLTPV
jgi:SAM-dependent methyltransferase